MIFAVGEFVALANDDLVSAAKTLVYAEPFVDITVLWHECTQAYIMPFSPDALSIV